MSRHLHRVDRIELGCKNDTFTVTCECGKSQYCGTWDSDAPKGWAKRGWLQILQAAIILLRARGKTIVKGEVVPVRTIESDLPDPYRKPGEASRVGKDPFGGLFVLIDTQTGRGWNRARDRRQAIRMIARPWQR